MKRRDLLKAGTAAAALVIAPRFSVSPVLAQEKVTFTIVPANDLNMLDPIWTTALIVGIYADVVYDGLYGYDSNYAPQPQMAQGHEVSEDGKTWTITLRDGLSFHDGKPVTAADCVASIKRWGARDTIGQTLVEIMDSIEASDDKTIVIKLQRRFPMLPFALGKPVSNMTAMMPEELANTDPFEKISVENGSGPFKFVAEEWVSGSKAVFEKFEDYKPREDGEPSFTAGPKVAYVDRMVWSTITDPSTAVAALQSGEVDALESVPTDFLSILRQDPNIQLIKRSLYSFAIMRFNSQLPPFDNVEIRRAVQSAVDQEAFMTAMFGAENSDIWLAGVGVFTPETPMANDAGLDLVTGDHDIEAAKQKIIDAGYDGSPIVLLDPADSASSHAAALLANDLLKRLGFNVDLQTMDWGTVVQRRAIKEPVSEGGWNIFFTSLNGPNNLNPAGQLGLRGNADDAWYGWPDNPEIEDLRMKWFFAESVDEQKQFARQIQESALDQVPYVTLGAYTSVSAYNKKWTDIPPELPIYFTMKPAD
ncbi:ABC transporter substrate-binding protein [Consotaella aegiceratis]|uniref:ABC transporter substrate-binding protein n=1 Tax=Consotaella aegiceratis TaxID=3097961 RepID=UPI002F3FFDC1